MESMMSILSTMDKLHHWRTWVIPQALRRAGILSEGWNPKLDRYEHKFLGFVTSFKHFYTVQRTHPYASMTKVDPLPFPAGPYLKEKSSHRQPSTGYEVIFPRGHVRVYHSLDELKQELSKIRTVTSQYEKLRTLMLKGKLQSKKAPFFVKKLTGLPLSQLGCDPHSIIVIKSLKTGQFVTRTPLSFKVSDGLKAAMQEEFSLPLPLSGAIGKTSNLALPSVHVLH